MCWGRRVAGIFVRGGGFQAPRRRVASTEGGVGKVDEKSKASKLSSVPGVHFNQKILQGQRNNSTNLARPD